MSILQHSLKDLFLLFLLLFFNLLLFFLLKLIELYPEILQLLNLFFPFFLCFFKS